MRDFAVAHDPQVKPRYFLGLDVATDEVMIEFAEFGGAKARGRRINFHKVEGLTRRMEGDYGPINWCCCGLL